MHKSLEHPHQTRDGAAERDAPTWRAHQHVGWARFFGAVLLAALAVVGCWFALDPQRFGVQASGVNLPEFVLAVSASLVVAAVFFVLSAQVTRAAKETRQATEEAEQRTEEALGDLREDVETLKDAVQRRREHRATQTEQAAQQVTTRPSVEAIDTLLESAAQFGLLDGWLQTSLRDNTVLSFRFVSLEGPQGPPRSGVSVEVVELGPIAQPQRLSARSVERLGPSGITVVATTFLEAETSATDAFADLYDQLVSRQRPAKMFDSDAERALERLSVAVTTLSAAIADAAKGLQIGSIKTVLDTDEAAILSRHPQGGKAIFKLDEPEHVVRLTPSLADQVGEEPEGVLAHPAVVRQLRYLRRQSEEAAKLRERKRASGITRQHRPT